MHIYIHTEIQVVSDTCFIIRLNVCFLSSEMILITTLSSYTIKCFLSFCLPTSTLLLCVQLR